MVHFVQSETSFRAPPLSGGRDGNEEENGMPFWGWILLIAGASAFLVGAVMAIVHGTHRRLPERDPQHGDPTNFTNPLPRHVAEADSMTERELEAEQTRDTPVR
jgi:hypothetical protein